MMNWKNLLSNEVIGKEYITGNNANRYLNKKYKPSPFELDYSKIINSASFRRLQDKTQVFPLDKNDFIRTRLTHSIETATIAKRLGSMVIDIIFNKEQDENRDDNVYFIPDIMMCAGLLHDIGNPPFGHFGEEVIGKWFENYLNNETNKFYGKKLKDVLKSEQCEDLKNFEGNAQALRLVAQLHFINSDWGMNLTSSVINTIIKYPTVSTDIKKTTDIKHKKMGIFCSEKELYDEVSKLTGAIGCRHPLTYLLEAADDIAYHTSDIEDAFKKGLFTFEELKNFIASKLSEYKDKVGWITFEKMEDLFGKLTEIENDIRENKFNCNKNVFEVEFIALQNWLEYVRGWLMHVISYSFDKHYNEIMNGQYKQSLFEGTFHEYSLQILMDILVKYVFSDKQIIKLELSAQTIISSLLDKLIPAVLYFDSEDRKKLNSKMNDKLISLISKSYLEEYYISSAGKTEDYKLYLRLLMVTDFISGMTDTYAKTLYQELNGF